METQQELDAWATDLNRAAFNKNRDIAWENGFVTFYSPVKKHPKLLIVSLQPGGNHTDYQVDKEKYRDGNGDFSLPKINVYLKATYIFARNIRKLLGAMESPTLLNESVVIPLIFFRAPNYAEWNTTADGKRTDMEQFSFGKVAEIINRLSPKTILVVGRETYKLLQKNVLKEIARQEVDVVIEGEKITHAKVGDYSIVVVRHLASRPSFSNAILEKMNKVLLKYI